MAVSTTYSSMLSSGQQAADFIKVLYPTIKNAGLSTKITCCDSEGWNNQKTMTAALISAGVESQLGVITSHSYSSSPNTAISTSLNVWETEYADLDGAWTDAWHSSGAVGEGLVWAQKIYSCVVGANCSGYLYWIGIWNNCNTNVSLMRITSGNVIDVSKRLWAFAMWSRFVRPGAVRVGTSGSGTGLSFAAFKNTDGTVTVQVINAGNSAQTVNVAVNGLTTVSVKAYITDNNNSVATLAASISGGQATASVPAYAMVAFVVSGTGSGSSSSSTTATTTTTTTKTTTITSSSTSTTSSTPTGGCAG
jgi:O-glycosyl hydrolase